VVSCEHVHGCIISKVFTHKHLNPKQDFINNRDSVKIPPKISNKNTYNCWNYY
jgi:hypothetical protein